MNSEVRARIRSIEEDRTHGAGKIAEYGLLALKKAAELSTAADAAAFLSEMAETARVVASARRTMPWRKGLLRGFCPRPAEENACWTWAPGQVTGVSFSLSEAFA